MFDFYVFFASLTCVYIYMYVCMYACMYVCVLVEGSLDVRLPAIWTDRKAEVGREREEKGRRRRSEKRTSQKKEDEGARR